MTVLDEALTGGASLVVGCVVGRWVAFPLVLLLERRSLARAGSDCRPDPWAGLEKGALRGGAGAVRPGDRRWCMWTMGLWLFVLALLGLSVVEVLLLGICGLSLLVALMCDVRVRLIPWETCAAVAMAGIALQMHVFGARGAIAGAVFAAVVAAACFASNALFLGRDDPSVGGGDIRCMAALSLASGETAPVGLAVSCVAMAMAGLCLAAVGKADLREGRPMAPFFMLWLLCAALSCAFA